MNNSRINLLANQKFLIISSVQYNFVSVQQLKHVYRISSVIMKYIIRLLNHFSRNREIESNVLCHTAWIWFWMTKRQGETFDNGFVFKKKIKSKCNGKKCCEVFWRDALTGHDQSSNQPISDKLPKWHFLTHAWNLKII